MFGESLDLVVVSESTDDRLDSEGLQFLGLVRRAHERCDVERSRIRVGEQTGDYRAADIACTMDELLFAIPIIIREVYLWLRERRWGSWWQTLLSR